MVQVRWGALAERVFWGTLVLQFRAATARVLGSACAATPCCNSACVGERLCCNSVHSVAAEADAFSLRRMQHARMERPYCCNTRHKHPPHTKFHSSAQSVFTYAHNTTHTRPNTVILSLSLSLSLSLTHTHTHVRAQAHASTHAHTHTHTHTHTNANANTHTQ